MLTPVAGRYGNIHLIVVALAFADALLLVEPVVTLPLRIPKDYNEGWNAFLAAHAFGETPLYPESSALITNNYPPLWFYLTGGLGKILGDNIIAGRVVAFASFLVVATNVGVITRRIGGSTTAALFAVLLFIGHMAAYSSSFISMNTPQWLAHALMTTSLIVLLEGAPNRGVVVIVAALMVISGMVKHNLIPLPLAVTVWLFFYDRRNFYYWLASAGVVLIGFMIIFYCSYGLDFFYGLFATPRSYTWIQFVHHLRRWFAPLSILLVTSLFFAIFNSHKREGQLILLYVFLAGLWGLFLAGDHGLRQHAVFDLIIGLAITAGLVLDQFRAWPLSGSLARSVFPPLGMLFLSLSILILLPQRLASSMRFLKNLKNTQAEAKADIAFIATYEGPAMCESLALCYWAGKTFAVDFYNTGQKLKAGVINIAALNQLLDQRHFSVIQVAQSRNGEPYSRLLPRTLTARLLDTYEVRRRSTVGGLFLVANEGN